MKNLSIFLILALIIFGCNSEEEDAKIRKWEIFALEKQVDDLNKQNEALSVVLKKMNSNHVSIRFFTADRVNDIEKIKSTIINYANNDSSPEVITSNQMISTKGRFYPRAFVFKHTQITRKLTQIVVKTLTAFDNHPSTKGDCLSSFLLEVDHDDPDGVVKNEIFDGLNLGQTVQLLELVQIRLLMEENKYLTDQFEHAINRMIAYPDEQRIN